MATALIITGYNADGVHDGNETSSGDARVVSVDGRAFVRDKVEVLVRFSTDLVAEVKVGAELRNIDGHSHNTIIEHGVIDSENCDGERVCLDVCNRK